MDLVLTNVAEGARVVVRIEGEIDVFSAPALRDHFLGLIRAGHHHLIADMDGVEFIDSTGLGALVNILKRVRTYDGSLRLVCTHERIVSLFRITVLPKVFPIHDTVAEAVASTD